MQAFPQRVRTWHQNGCLRLRIEWQWQGSQGANQGVGAGGFDTQCTAQQHPASQYLVQMNLNIEITPRRPCFRDETDNLSTYRPVARRESDANIWVVVPCGDRNSNPKRERGPHALPRLRFALAMGFSENSDFSNRYHYQIMAPCREGVAE